MLFSMSYPKSVGHGLSCLPASLIISLFLLGCGLTDAEEHYNRGVRLERQSNWQGAVAEYTEAIRLQPQFPLAYNNRGVAEAILGEYDRAIQDYSEAIKGDPEFAEAYNNRGVAYNDTGNYQNAIADFESAVILDKWQARYYANRGVSYYYLKNYQTAQQDFDKAISLNSQVVVAFRFRGLTRVERGEFDEALSDFDSALLVAEAKLQSSPDSAILLRQIAELYLDRGIVYHRLGNALLAQKDLQKARELDPSLEPRIAATGVGS